MVLRFFEARCRTSLPTFSLSGYSIMEDNCLWQKTKTEIHVTTVFDGELDAADVFVSLIAQKYGQNTGKKNLAKTQDLGYNKDEVQKNRVPSGLCG